LAAVWLAAGAAAAAFAAGASWCARMITNARMASASSPVITLLNKEFVAALNDENIKTSLRNSGLEPAPDSPSEFEAFIRSETSKWANVIRKGHIKLD